ncbi:helix-turn-helix domain-containing protein [Mesorhizobium sp.]|uniref:helix-turn-helix domain-containing protein n=1 Tax=Mesorhizobium sp. TaxID=1871066 RepID=UPI0025BEF71F|nr:helix-turn-helix domain-containing protein [Mesorhizobium sp.]
MADEPKVGRPTDYDPAYVEQAAKLCALGATDKELADFFGVATSTIYLWRNLHVEFSEAVIAGKESADARVERALYNRAVGYTFESEKVFQAQGEIIRADILEHVPPDPAAAMNWLKNRQPNRWRDKQEVEHNVSNELSELMERIAANGKRVHSED